MRKAILVGVLVLLMGFAARAAEPAAVEPKLKVVVPGVHAHPGVGQGTAGVLTDLLLEALLTRHGIRALGPPDLRAILSVEQQRLLLGCQDESCFAELAGALGADWLVAGSVGRLDDLHVLSLQLIDPKKAQVSSRASISLSTIKDAPKALGPLLDRLLGQQARARTPMVLKKAGPAPDKPAMGQRDYCRLSQKHFARLERQAWSKELTEVRRQLLLDLVATAYLQQFQKKVGCYWQYASGLDNRLQTAFLCATNRSQAIDLARRRLDWFVYRNQLKLLEEAYPRGLEMEKMGTGQRLRSLPFQVVDTVLPAPEDTPEVRSFLEAWTEAQSVLSQVLAHAKADDRKGLGALFAKTSKKSSIDRTHKALRTRFGQGFVFDACPLYLQNSGDIENGARLLADKGRLKTCARSKRNGVCSTVQPTLVKQDGQWKISSW